jgi:transposase-like protein
VSRQTLFEQHSDAVLQALKDGASIPDAARLVDIGDSTIKGWLRRGRDDPKSKYGGFAASVDAAFSDRKLPPNGELPADRDELLVLASRAARSGNVQAMRLLGELLLPGDPDATDELTKFDQLARQGQKR